MRSENMSKSLLTASASEMTYIVSSGALNSTHSLTLNRLPYHQNFVLFIGNRGHWTRWRRQIFGPEIEVTLFLRMRAKEIAKT